MSAECADLPCPSPPTTQPPNDDSDDDRLHAGYIILIVFVVLLVLIIVACLLIYKCKKRKKKPKKTVHQGIHALAHLGVGNPNSPLYSQDIHQPHYGWVAQSNEENDNYVPSVTPTSQMGSDGVFNSATPQPPVFFIDSEENTSHMDHASKKRDRNQNEIGKRNRSRDEEKISHVKANQEDIYASPKKAKRPRSFSEPHNHKVKQESTSPKAINPPLRHWKPVEDLRQTDFNFMDSPVESLDVYPYNGFISSNGNIGETIPAVENNPISQTEFNFMDSPIESTYDYTSNGFIPSNGYIQTLRESDYPSNPILNRSTDIPLKTVPQKPKRQKKSKSKPQIQRQSSALGKIYLPPPMYGQTNPAFVPEPDYSIFGDVQEPMVFIPKTDYPVYAGYDSYDMINGSLV